MNNNNVLVVVAHPDDETIGCAGTIIRHIKSDDNVFIVTLSDGETSRSEKVPDKLNRYNNFHNALGEMGVKDFVNLDYPDQRLDTVPLLDLVIEIEEIKRKIKPNIIYTHFHSDLNVDHQITHKAVMTASRPLPSETAKEILCFEIVSSTEWAIGDKNIFRPNLFVNIEPYLNQKIKALECYADEMCQPPHARSIESIVNLAKYRGTQNGMYAAEAFMIERCIRDTGNI